MIDNWSDAHTYGLVNSEYSSKEHFNLVSEHLVDNWSDAETTAIKLMLRKHFNNFVVNEHLVKSFPQMQCKNNSQTKALTTLLRLHQFMYTV